jgi:hypothetical protein
MPIRGDHREALAITHMVYAVLALVSGAIGFATFMAESPAFWLRLLGVTTSGWNGFAGLRLALGVIVLGYALCTAVLSFAAGWGLRRNRRWSRPVGVAAAVIALPMFPFGTAVALLTFWLVLAPQVHPPEHNAYTGTADAFR